MQVNNKKINENKMPWARLFLYVYEENSNTLDFIETTQDFYFFIWTTSKEWAYNNRLAMQIETESAFFVYCTSITLHE